MKNKIKRIIKSGVMMLKAEKKIAVPYPINAEKILSGKIALITGGSGGLGMAIAKAFIDSGCKVIIAGTNESKLEVCRKKLGGG